MKPSTLLTALCFAAVLIGAKMHSAHTIRRFTATEPEANGILRHQIQNLSIENEQLQRDIASLRALLTAEAPVEIPAELISFVENELSLSFSTPPLAQLSNEESMRNAAGQIWLAAFSETGLAMRSYAFERLGIVPVNQNFMGQITAAQAVGAIGIYDHSASETLLKNDFDMENVHHQAALVRLLAIALLDAHYPLPQHTDDDHFHARQALHGGRASQLQERFYALQARHIGFVSQTENTEALELFQALPNYVRAITTFPNTVGKDYLATRPNKDAAQAALTDSALNTKALILQQPEAAHKLPAEPASSDLTQLETQLGLLTVQSYLLPSERPNIKALLADYHSDTLSISIEQDTPVIRWEVRWATEQSANTFRAAAQQLSSALEAPPAISQDHKKILFTVTESNILGE